MNVHNNNDGIFHLLARNRFFRIFVLLLCLGATVHLLSTLWFVFKTIDGGAIHEDYSLYAIVGRGMLNGLKSYTDLFETKPPGIFLLAATSQLITGNYEFALYVERILIFLFLLLFIIICWKEIICARDRWILIICVWLLVLLTASLILYSEEMSGGLQTEIFGGLIGSLYVLTLQRKNNTIVIDSLRAVLLLGSFGMKEPFLLTTFAAALLLSKELRSMLRNFLLPFCLAAMLGIAILVLIGSLGSYIHTYLPVILLNRISYGSQPLIVRGLNIWKIVGNLFFSSVPFLGILIPSLWSGVPLMRKAYWPGNSLSLSLIFGTSFLAIIALQGLYWLLTLHTIGFVGHLTFFCVWMFMATSGYLLLRHCDKEICSSLTISVFSLYLTALAIGSGNYNYYHFIFALPVYTALILLLIRSLPNVGAHRVLAMCVSVLILLCAYTSYLKPKYLAILQHRREIGPLMNATLVRHFDSLMSDCGLRRYYAESEYQRLQESHFSPIGPLFIRHPIQYFPPNHPLFLSTEKNIREKAELLLLPHNGALPEFLAEDKSLFTNQVPVCAGMNAQALQHFWDLYFRI